MEQSGWAAEPSTGQEAAGLGVFSLLGHEGEEQGAVRDKADGTGCKEEKWREEVTSR